MPAKHEGHPIAEVVVGKAAVDVAVTSHANSFDTEESIEATEEEFILTA